VSEFVPNPTADNARLFILTGKEQAVEIEMFNYLGEIVKQGSSYLNKGSNTINFELGDLAAGTYTARVVAGPNTYIRRIVITR
ncbi:MAG: T9SS type A sorting domain-containing protein, partial [Candidatus Calescibacterium sp.]|nr:T9SS type A sorting domain-containing protein [Candidatus Calescibacterium sp.]